MTGAAGDRDTFKAPGTKVVQSYDVSGQHGVISLSYPLGPLDDGFYVRCVASDGNRLGPD